MWTTLAAALIGLHLGGCRSANDRFAPQDGDLLFQDLDGGPLCEAIETVTHGRGGARFSHVGVAARDGARCTVIEARSRGVTITPLENFLKRSSDARGRPKVLVGRLKAEYRRAIDPALARTRARVGMAYDDEFRLDNGKYYCSELVWEAYLDPAGGQHLFAVEPMTFRAPGSDQPMPVWAAYFADRKLPVPEGLPGCNPGGLSRSAAIDIVHMYGEPSGWSAAGEHDGCH